MKSLLLFLAAVLGFVLPLLIPAAYRVYPSRRAVSLAAVPLLLTFALVIEPRFWVLVVAGDVLFCLVLVYDLASLPRRRAFSSIERSHAKIASLRKRHPVTLTISYAGNRPLNATVRDGWQPELAPSPKTLVLTLAPQGRTTVEYDLRPQKRGAFTAQTAYLRTQTPLGLWFRDMAFPCQSLLHVYPDIKQISQYALLARLNRLSLIGVRRVRRAGQEDEFERLRDYTIDDEYRWIEWRATARRQKLTVKDFQHSQSQRVIFLVDCGRMMTNETAGLSMLDHAWNAVLMLSYVALSQGDSVGLLAFSDEIHTFLSPRGGKKQMARLLHAAFDRFPRLVEPRFDLAFRYLAGHVRKRALVVLITHLIDEVNGQHVERYLTNLAGRHLPLGVFLRDVAMFAPVAQPPSDDKALWKAAAAARILLWRHELISSIRHKGALVLDVFPEKMTAPLINQYLDIKARHLL